MHNFPFKLSEFQEKAISGLINNDHVLITAHTGSGKTLPAEFAIEHFVKNGKKVIYTAPIKALSNQKYYEFQKKFQTISFGILTGDIKFNPEADVLIMTTEILKNTLYLKNNGEKDGLEFDIDIQTELGCVVFDEVHYINDPSRGKVWEETIMLLPEHIQMLMLSATIDKPERFARWIENIKNNTKKVVIAGTNERVVPLVHYMWFNTKQKPVQDKQILSMINSRGNKLCILKDNETTFDKDLYLETCKIKKYLKQEKLLVQNAFVLNNLIEHLKSKGMLPAICFVFSRKMVEKYASLIEKSVVSDDDCKFQESIDNECFNILKKLPNYQEYLQLPEYQFVLGLLRKGIAIHHSGVAPILREMVELLFSKGYIKLLFATETFAVGINMPTKTVIFTDFTKYDGSDNRILRSPEYTQMAGRAGRRGLDTIGHVIHLTNMFEIPEMREYMDMMNGKPQLFVSKFKISYNLLLNILSNTQDISEIKDHVEKSMMNLDITDAKKSTLQKIKDQEHEIEKFSEMINDNQYFRDYLDLKQEFQTVKPKKRRAIQEKITEVERKMPNVIESFNNKCMIDDIKSEIIKDKQYLENTESYLLTVITNTIEVMQKFGFLDSSNNLTIRGQCAMKIQEVNSFVMCDLLFNTNNFKSLDECELISLLSSFTSLTIQEKYKCYTVDGISSKLQEVIKSIEPLYNKYYDEELRYDLDTGSEWDINYDLVKVMQEWYYADDELTCKTILQQLQNEKEIFLGEFVKTLLKITNIVNELVKVSELLCDIELQSKLKNCNEKIMKYVVTNQSLYI